MATFAFYTQGTHPRLYTFISLTKLSFLFVLILKAKTSFFPAAKALKHNKRQEKTKGIEPSTKESPNQQNRKTRYHQLLLPAGTGSQSHLIRQH